MRHLFFALSLLLPSSAFASSVKLMDCSFSGGADLQQATVVRMNGELRLIELSNSGSTTSRVVSESEWQEKRIRISSKYSAMAILSYEDGSWYLKSDVFNGYGICEDIPVADVCTNSLTGRLAAR